MRIEFLSKKEMGEIHSAAKDLIAKRGMKVTSEQCRMVFDRAGAEVEHEKQIVRISEALVEESLKAVDRKSAHIIYARSPKFDVRLGDSLYAYPGEGGTYVIDLESGQRRQPLVRDVVNFARLCDALPNVHTVIANTVPVDAHPKFRGLYMAKALFENTSKPCNPGGLIKGTERYFYEMAAAVVGGREELKKRPIVRGSASLSRMSQVCEALNLGLPIELDLFRCDDAMASAGGTSPVTLAGTLVNGVARCLTQITLAQTIKPGTPMRSLVRAGILDLKTGTFSTGSPEMGMLAAAGAQIFKKFYGLPVDAGWAGGDSKIMDEQLGYEKMIVWLLSGLAGADQISGMSLLESGLTASYAQLVIDDEIIGIVKRVLKGIIFDEEHLALELLKKIEPGGLFTGERHTLKYVREEHFQPKITDRRPRGVWEERGSKDVIIRANEAAREMLKKHMPEPLPESTRRELNEIIKRAEKDYAKHPETFEVPSESIGWV